MRRLTAVPGLGLGLGLGLALVLLLVAACGRAPDLQQGYRRDVPITSIVFFDPARFAGDWVEVAAFRPLGAARCTGARARYSLAPDGSLTVVEQSCARAGSATRQGRAVLTGPGRLSIRVGGESDTYWMLWVDEGYRTAVVGMPSGKLGFILNRDASIPPDRMAAAREILEWNGYDLTRLVMAPQG